MSAAPTRQLVRDWLESDRAALGPVLERLRPRLVLWSTSRMSPGLRAKLEPEDVAQEILLTVHRSVSSFRGADERSFLAWFFRVAENRLRGLATYFAAAKRQEAERVMRSRTSPSSAAARTEREAALIRALEGLSTSHRLVIRLRCIEGREFADVAEAMDRNPTAVRVLYCRALKALKAALAGSKSASRSSGAKGGPDAARG
jgi:RNA polymerase sigma factor (sigma-70 family)